MTHSHVLTALLLAVAAVLVVAAVVALLRAAAPTSPRSVTSTDPIQASPASDSDRSTQPGALRKASQGETGGSVGVDGDAATAFCASSKPGAMDLPSAPITLACNQLMSFRSLPTPTQQQHARETIEAFLAESRAASAAHSAAPSSECSIEQQHQGGAGRARRALPLTIGLESLLAAAEAARSSGTAHTYGASAPASRPGSGGPDSMRRAAVRRRPRSTALYESRVHAAHGNSKTEYRTGAAAELARALTNTVGQSLLAASAAAFPGCLTHSEITCVRGCVQLLASVAWIPADGDAVPAHASASPSNINGRTLQHGTHSHGTMGALHRFYNELVAHHESWIGAAPGGPDSIASMHTSLHPTVPAAIPADSLHPVGVSSHVQLSVGSGDAAVWVTPACLTAGEPSVLNVTLQTQPELLSTGWVRVLLTQSGSAVVNTEVPTQTVPHSHDGLDVVSIRVPVPPLSLTTAQQASSLQLYVLGPEGADVLHSSAAPPTLHVAARLLVASSEVAQGMQQVVDLALTDGLAVAAVATPRVSTPPLNASPAASDGSGMPDQLLARMAQVWHGHVHPLARDVGLLVSSADMFAAAADAPGTDPGQARAWVQLLQRLLAYFVGQGTVAPCCLLLRTAQRAGVMLSHGPHTCLKPHEALAVLLPGVDTPTPCALPVVSQLVARVRGVVTRAWLGIGSLVLQWLAPLQNPAVATVASSLAVGLAMGAAATLWVVDTRGAPAVYVDTAGSVPASPVTPPTTPVPHRALPLVLRAVVMLGTAAMRLCGALLRCGIAVTCGWLALRHWAAQPGEQQGQAGVPAEPQRETREVDARAQLQERPRLMHTAASAPTPIQGGAARGAHVQHGGPPVPGTVPSRTAGLVPGPLDRSVSGCSSAVGSSEHGARTMSSASSGACSMSMWIAPFTRHVSQQPARGEEHAGQCSSAPTPTSTDTSSSSLALLRPESVDEHTSTVTKTDDRATDAGGGVPAWADEHLRPLHVRLVIAPPAFARHGLLAHGTRAPGYGRLPGTSAGQRMVAGDVCPPPRRHADPLSSNASSAPLSLADMQGWRGFCLALSLPPVRAGDPAPGRASPVPLFELVAMGPQPDSTTGRNLGPQAAMLHTRSLDSSAAVAAAAPEPPAWVAPPPAPHPMPPVVHSTHGGTGSLPPAPHTTMGAARVCLGPASLAPGYVEVSCVLVVAGPPSMSDLPAAVRAMVQRAGAWDAPQDVPARDAGAEVSDGAPAVMDHLADMDCQLLVGPRSSLGTSEPQPDCRECQLELLLLDERELWDSTSGSDDEHGPLPLLPCASAPPPGMSDTPPPPSCLELGVRGGADEPSACNTWPAPLSSARGAKSTPSDTLSRSPVSHLTTYQPLRWIDDTMPPPSQVGSRESIHHLSYLSSRVTAGQWTRSTGSPPFPWPALPNGGSSGGLGSSESVLAGRMGSIGRSSMHIHTPASMDPADSGPVSSSSVGSAFAAVAQQPFDGVSAVAQDLIGAGQAGLGLRESRGDRDAARQLSAASVGGSRSRRLSSVMESLPSLGPGRMAASGGAGDALDSELRSGGNVGSAFISSHPVLSSTTAAAAGDLLDFVQHSTATITDAGHGYVPDLVLPSLGTDTPPESPVLLRVLPTSPPSPRTQDSTQAAEAGSGFSASRLACLLPPGSPRGSGTDTPARHADSASPLLLPDQVSSQHVDRARSLLYSPHTSQSVFGGSSSRLSGPPVMGRSSTDSSATLSRRPPLPPGAGRRSGAQTQHAQHDSFSGSSTALRLPPAFSDSCTPTSLSPGAGMFNSPLLSPKPPPSPRPPPSPGLTLPGAAPAWGGSLLGDMMGGDGRGGLGGGGLGYNSGDMRGGAGGWSAAHSTGLVPPPSPRPPASARRVASATALLPPYTPRRMDSASGSSGPGSELEPASMRPRAASNAALELTSPSRRRKIDAAIADAVYLPLSRSPMPGSAHPLLSPPPLLAPALAVTAPADPASRRLLEGSAVMAAASASLHGGGASGLPPLRASDILHVDQRPASHQVVTFATAVDSMAAAHVGEALPPPSPCRSRTLAPPSPLMREEIRLSQQLFAGSRALAGVAPASGPFSGSFFPPASPGPMGVPHPVAGLPSGLLTGASGAASVSRAHLGNRAFASGLLPPLASVATSEVTGDVGTSGVQGGAADLNALQDMLSGDLAVGWGPPAQPLMPPACTAFSPLLPNSDSAAGPPPPQQPLHASQPFLLDLPDRDIPPGASLWEAHHSVSAPSHEAPGQSARFNITRTMADELCPDAPTSQVSALLSNASHPAAVARSAPGVGQEPWRWPDLSGVMGPGIAPWTGASRDSGNPSPPASPPPVSMELLVQDARSDRYLAHVNLLLSPPAPLPPQSPHFPRSPPRVARPPVCAWPTPPPAAALQGPQRTASGPTSTLLLRSPDAAPDVAENAVGKTVEAGNSSAALPGVHGTPLGTPVLATGADPSHRATPEYLPSTWAEARVVSNHSLPYWPSPSGWGEGGGDSKHGVSAGQLLGSGEYAAPGGGDLPRQQSGGAGGRRVNSGGSEGQGGAFDALGSLQEWQQVSTQLRKAGSGGASSTLATLPEVAPTPGCDMPPSPEVPGLPAVAPAGPSSPIPAPQPAAARGRPTQRRLSWGPIARSPTPGTFTSTAGPSAVGLSRMPPAGAQAGPGSPHAAASVRPTLGGAYPEPPRADPHQGLDARGEMGVEPPRTPRQAVCARRVEGPAEQLTGDYMGVMCRLWVREDSMHVAPQAQTRLARASGRRTRSGARDGHGPVGPNGEAQQDRSQAGVAFALDQRVIMPLHNPRCTRVCWVLPVRPP